MNGVLRFDPDASGTAGLPALRRDGMGGWELVRMDGTPWPAEEPCPFCRRPGRPPGTKDDPETTHTPSANPPSPAD